MITREEVLNLSTIDQITLLLNSLEEIERLRGGGGILDKDTLSDQEKIDKALYKTQREIMQLWAGADSVDEIKGAWAIVARHFKVAPMEGKIGERPQCQLLQ